MKKTSQVMVAAAVLMGALSVMEARADKHHRGKSQAHLPTAAQLEASNDQPKSSDETVSNSVLTTPAPSQSAAVPPQGGSASGEQAVGPQSAEPANSVPTTP